MSRVIDSKTYDADIISQGLQFQKDNYYEPKDFHMRTRIDVVLKAVAPQNNEKILDIGCGVGTFAYHCAKKGAMTTGIDYSSESVAAAQALTESYGLSSRAHFVVGNALQLPFENGSFDKVVSADFIEHITDDEKYLLCREINRVLKPGGQAVIFTPNLIREKIGDYYWGIRHHLFGDTIPVNDLHYGLITRKGFEKIMKVSGWDYRVSYIDIGRPYLCRLPCIKHYLSLNLLWTATTNS